MSLLDVSVGLDELAGTIDDLTAEEEALAYGAFAEALPSLMSRMVDGGQGDEAAERFVAGVLLLPAKIRRDLAAFLHVLADRVVEVAGDT